jgi:hypothetical protein
MPADGLQRFCLSGSDLEPYVQREKSKDWTLVDEGTEGRKKIGFISTTPGSKLVRGRVASSFEVLNHSIFCQMNGAKQPLM